MSKTKHNSNTISVVASSTALVVLGILLMDPFDITMNNMILALVSGLLFASFGVFAGLLWREQASDERESVIIDKAGRLGYLAGLSILVVALVVQSFEHNVDGWLVLTIASMILTKQLYIQMNR